jgi:hypothetical protein
MPAPRLLVTRSVSMAQVGYNDQLAQQRMPHGTPAHTDLFE